MFSGLGYDLENPDNDSCEDSMATVRVRGIEVVAISISDNYNVSVA